MVAIATTAGMLAKTALFGRMAPAELDKVARLMREATYPPGAAIFRRGDPGRGLYLVMEGQVRLSILSPRGREVSFIQASPGTIFGDIAALDGGPRTADATAIDQVIVMSLDRKALMTIVENHPAAAAGAIGLLCERLRNATEQLETIALHSVEVRLARFLLARARHGASATKAGRVTVDLGMAKSDLALFISVSPPKLSVAFGALEADGVIVRKGRRVDCDVAALHRLAEGE